jgi:hypothetical protein
MHKMLGAHTDDAQRCTRQCSASKEARAQERANRAREKETERGDEPVTPGRSWRKALSATACARGFMSCVSTMAEVHRRECSLAAAEDDDQLLPEKNFKFPSSSSSSSRSLCRVRGQFLACWTRLCER